MEKKVCAFCDSRDLDLIIDFGKVALAGAFLKQNEFEREVKYSQKLKYCKNCFAMQIVDVVSPDILFQDYFYFSSSIRTLQAHFQTYAEEMIDRFLSHPGAKVLEFGCNDGVLLKPFATSDIDTVIGVDPATNVIEKIQDSNIVCINDYFNNAVADYIVAEYGSIDLVMANNVFAHIPEINETTSAIKKVLSADGVFVFEVHYMGKVVEELQYDMIYHEHLYYYSLLSLMKHFAKFDMMIFDVKPVPIHAGSVRFYACNLDSKWSTPHPSVKKLKRKELERGYDLSSTFSSFGERVNETKFVLKSLLQTLKDNGKTIVGYGASGRANTILQFCGLTDKLLDYMIDDAPAKQGYFTPGSHLEIFPSDVLNSNSPPDYILLFAWSFLDEVCKRNVDYLKGGGKIIVPLPEVKIYDINDLHLENL